MRKLIFSFTNEKNTFCVAEEKFHNDSIADTHPLRCENFEFDIEGWYDVTRVEISMRCYPLLVLKEKLAV